MPHPVARASVADTLAVLAGIALPALAKGPLIRRRGAVHLATWLDLDRRAIRLMQRLRARYGPGPLLLRLPIRNQALLLDEKDARRVLHETPKPFAAASREKRAALRHFEPHAVLASPAADRPDRRAFNETVLDSECPVHGLAPDILRAVDAEIAPLMARAAITGGFGWDDFARAWARLARRIVLGAEAADDEALSQALSGLRADANWVVKPRRDRLRRRFFARLQQHLDRAEPGSLAARIAATPHTPHVQARDQVPHWLFAYDAAGIATARAYALLLVDPAAHARAEAELDAAPDRTRLPYLRAAVLESVRLWPTTPMILRQSDRATGWAGTQLPAGTGVLIFPEYFHRDDKRLSYADSFRPDLWMRDAHAGGAPFMPFSDGPAGCPGINLVQLTGSAVLAALIDAGPAELVAPRTLTPGALPAGFDFFALRFRVGHAA